MTDDQTQKTVIPEPPRSGGRRESDPDLVAIGAKLDTLIDLFKTQNGLMQKQTEQHQRSSEMLRTEFHENRELGRKLAAVLVDVQLDRVHQRLEPERHERLVALAEGLAATPNGRAPDDH